MTDDSWYNSTNMTGMDMVAFNISTTGGPTSNVSENTVKQPMDPTVEFWK